MFRIMLVYDDPDMIELIANFLSEKSFEIATAADGEEALEMTGKGQQFAVIIASQYLPKSGAEKLLQALRQAGNQTPVIMISRRIGDIEDSEFDNAGFTGVFKWPFNLKADLLPLIQKALQP